MKPPSINWEEGNAAKLLWHRVNSKLRRKEMIARALAAIALTAQAAFAADTLVLSPSALGPLQLIGKPATVSEAKLRKLFGQYSVKYEIGSGDSPDFHYFEVANSKGKVLFTIKSFIEGSGAGKKTVSEVPISILQVWSKEIPDVYGLRVGDRVKDITTKRGMKMKFGAGHHDALMGDGEIFYSLVTGSDFSPEGLTKADAIKGNWEIRFISWPGAAWE